MDAVPLQWMFIALSNDLFQMLTTQQGLAAGCAILIGGGALAGLLGALWQNQSHGVAASGWTGADRGGRLGRIPGADPTHPSAIRRGGLGFPRIHLHLGGA